MKKHARDIIELYERHASAFVQRRSQSLFEKPHLDRFLAHVPEAGHVLDLGCGFGDPIARYVLDQGRSVTGVDTSAGLISIARTALPTATWIINDMRTLDLQQTFEGILAWHSSFHLTPADQHAMFEVYARHAKPNSALMFTSGAEAGERMGTFEGEPLYHASLSPDAYLAALDTHGFDLIERAQQGEGPDASLIWLARKRGSVGQQTR